MSTVGTTARRGANLLASVLWAVGLVIVAVVVGHIALTLLNANPANFLTEFLGGWAATFNLGLGNLFTPDEPKLTVALNYGVAAVIWLVLTAVVSRLVRRLA